MKALDYVRDTLTEDMLSQILNDSGYYNDKIREIVEKVVTHNSDMSAVRCYCVFDEFYSDEVHEYLTGAVFLKVKDGNIIAEF